MIRRQFARFVVIGLLSTAVNYAVFAALYRATGTGYLLSSGVGFVAGVVVGFAFNRRWTFEAEGAPASYLPAYFGVYAASLVLGLAFLKAGVALAGIRPEVANLLTIGLTTCTNFAGTKLLVFRA